MKARLLCSLVLFVSLAAQAGTELKLLKGSFKTKELLTKITASSDGITDYVLQFKNSIKESDKKELQNSGVTVFRYLPDDALIVRAPKATLQSYANRTGKVNAILPFQADWKLSSNIPTLSVYSIGHREAILVTTFQAADRERVAVAIQQIDPQANFLSNEERYISVAADLGTLPKVAAIEGVEFVEKVESFQPLNIQLEAVSPKDTPPAAPGGDYTDLTGYEAGTKILKLDAAWSQGYSGSGQIVGMADTGLDVGDNTHVSNDFQGAIHSAYYFGAGAKDWSDPMGHGTHVAGSVLGRGVISHGAIHGGAYSATLVPEGMWSPIIDNLNVPPQLSKLFDPAYADGARVHTNSWGAGANFGAYDSMAQKVDQFMWDHPDFLILFAAGNSGIDKDANGKIDPNSIGSPGTAKNCVTVGASKNYVLKGGIQKKISDLKTSKDNWPAEPIWSSSLSETPNGMAMFSSRGPTQDNRIKPDVVAPGTNILSTRSHVSGADPLWGVYNDDYVWSGGTSMATPLAAGFAAVTREILIKKQNVANPSAALVKAVMMHTAFDMYPGQFGQGTPTQELDHRPNIDEGYGRLDMEKIVGLSSSTQIADENTGIADGETFERTVTLSAGQSLLANMVYTDAPGTPAAGASLVNNLDLIVVTPDGKELGSHDTVNNAEVVEAASLPAGTYKIQVRGTKVPMGNNGKQPFALIFTAI